MKQLLLSAAHEIRDLRRRNEILQAKQEMIDLFACVLHTQPARKGEGYSEDIACLIDKEIVRINQEEQAAMTKPVEETA